MIQISKLDNKSYVFFNATLFDLLFCFNGREYSSVNECYNDNKFNNMWNPRSIPAQHRVNLTADGFMLDDNGKCILCGSFTNKEFELYVKSYLFCKYYDQIECHLSDIQKCKYVEAYRACKYITDKVTLYIDNVSFREYPLVVSDGEIVLVLNKDVKYLDISGVNTVHMTMKSIAKLRRPLSFIISNSKCVFNIHIDKCDEDDKYIIGLIRGCSNVSLTDTNIDYGMKVVSVGSITEELPIDWNNIIILDGV